MAHRGVCPDMACQRVAIELERQASERRACQVVADELGIPVKTVLTWIHRNKVTSNEVIIGQVNHIEKEPTTYTSDLHTLIYDSGSNKILFRLQETDGKWSLLIQEYRLGLKGKDVATKNRLIMPLDLFSRFRDAMDATNLMIRNGISTESGGDCSNPHENDGVEPPAGDGASDTEDDGEDDIGAETEPLHAHVDGTPDESGLIRCSGCRRYTPGLQLKDQEMKGSCHSQALSWDGELFQVPYELHCCLNFCGHDQHNGGGRAAWEAK